MGCHFSNEQPDARFLSTKAKPQYAPDRTFIPLHITLEAFVDVKKKRVDAVCTTEIELLENTNEVFFNAIELKVKSVRVNGKKNSFKMESEKEGMTIPLKSALKKASIEIHYSVENPPLGIFFIHPTKERPDKPYQAWTHSEAQEARFWYPCQDQPETKCPIEYWISVNEPFKVVANGDLVDVKTDQKNKRNTFHWKFNHPNPSYLNAFMIGDFAEVRDKIGKTDVLYYCEKGREEDIKRSFGNTPQMIQFFSEYTGYTYPHKKYAQVAVADFIYGGMEHTTCTTQTDLYLQDETAHNEYWYPGEMLAAHELAHQWFGDLLTCRDWAHGWLNESFAVYFECLWMEKKFGKKEYQYELYQNYRTYTDEDKNKYRRPIVTNTYVEPSDIFDRHLYEKGCLLLHSIRGMLGDEAFQRSIGDYVKKHAGGSVITEDLLQSFRSNSGKNLTQFFDEFIYRGGHPELKVESYYDSKKKQTVLRVIQTQSGDLYHFPVSVKIIPKNGKAIIETKQIAEKENVFTFPMKTIPFNVVFDPEVVVLKGITTIKSRDMWNYQLKNDPHVIHRISAANELAKFASEGDILAIENAMRNDPFWGVRAESALALATTKLQSAYLKIMSAFAHEKDNRVKQTMLRTLGDYASHDIHDFLIQQTKHPNSYLIPSEAYRSLGRSRNTTRMGVLEKGLTQKSWFDLIPIGAIGGIAALQTMEAMRALTKYTHPRYSNRIRQAVAQNLGIIGKGRVEALETLTQLTKDPYFNLQIAAAAALGELGDSRAIPTLLELQKGHRDPRLVRTALESIRKINGVLELPAKTETNPTTLTTKKKKN
jgi:aminopeptidase N